MTVRVDWVRYGRPAAEALRDAIGAAKGGEPLTPVSVIVPSNQVGVAARRLLGSGAVGPVCGRGTGLAAVSFLTVYRMAELLGAPRLAGSNRRPVSTPVLAAALRGALSESPGVFAPVATHPATEMALVAAYKELRDVSSDALDRLATRSARAGDVVRLHRLARARLEPDWYDERDLTDAAAHVVASTFAVTAQLDPVVVYLPQRLSRHGARLIRAIGDRSDVVVLAGSTGDPRADADVSGSVRRLVDPPALPPPPPSVDALSVVTPQNTHIVTASDADDEVRAAVRRVVAAALMGTPLERIAILHASPQPYARLIHEHLDAAGIAHNGQSVMPLTARVAARTLLGLLALAPVGFRREEVFAWLAGAPVQHKGRRVPVAAWERASRDAGVVGGREQWDRQLAHAAVEADAAADAVRDDEPEWMAEKRRSEAAHSRDLREFVLGLIDDIARSAAGAQPWADRARWVRGHLDTLLGGERRRAAWPLAEQKAAERVERAIERLSGLDRLEGPVSLDVFSRTLTLELDADLGRVGRMGEGVVVGPVAMGVGLDLDLVAVLGLAEGSFPSPTRDDSLLPDHERAVVGDELPLRSQRVERQHHQLLASLGGARHHLLGVPRGDLRRSNERVPSRWAVQIATVLAGAPFSSAELLAERREWLTHVASFDAGIRHVGFPSSAQEHRLRALMAANSARSSDRAPLTLGDDIFAAGADVVASRRSDRLTRFDGNLDGSPVPSPVDRPMSPTRLEQWAGCPYAYFVRNILGVLAVENPEARLRISPLDWGNLIHQAFETFINEVLARPASEQPTPSQAWGPADEARILAIGEELCAEFEQRGLTGRPIFWKSDKRRVLADLGRFVREDNDHRRGHHTRPVAAELAFGSHRTAVGTVDLSLPDGRTVEFHGSADRVDIAEDGRLHVVDYKTGRADRYLKLSEDNPDEHGTKLQLPIYGLAARLQQNSPDAPVRAEYWFTSSKGNFRRVGYSVTDSVLARIRTVVGMIVGAIELGVFNHNPTATSTSPFVECPFCDPDALGVVDLRRRIARKSEDPALKAFFDVTAPSADPPREEQRDAQPDAPLEEIPVA